MKFKKVFNFNLILLFICLITSFIVIFKLYKVNSISEDIIVNHFSNNFGNDSFYYTKTEKEILETISKLPKSLVKIKVKLIDFWSDAGNFGIKKINKGDGSFIRTVVGLSYDRHKLVSDKILKISDENLEKIKNTHDFGRIKRSSIYLGRMMKFLSEEKSDQIANEFLDIINKKMLNTENIFQLRSFVSYMGFFLKDVTPSPKLNKKLSISLNLLIKSMKDTLDIEEIQESCNELLLLKNNLPFDIALKSSKILMESLEEISDNSVFSKSVSITSNFLIYIYDETISNSLIDFTIKRIANAQKFNNKINLKDLTESLYLLVGKTPTNKKIDFVIKIVNLIDEEITSRAQKGDSTFDNSFTFLSENLKNYLSLMPLDEKNYNIVRSKIDLFNKNVAVKQNVYNLFLDITDILNIVKFLPKEEKIKESKSKLKLINNIIKNMSEGSIDRYNPTDIVDLVSLSVKFIENLPDNEQKLESTLIMGYIDNIIDKLRSSKFSTVSYILSKSSSIIENLDLKKSSYYIVDLLDIMLKTDSYIEKSRLANTIINILEKNSIESEEIYKYCIYMMMINLNREDTISDSSYKINLNEDHFKAVKKYLNSLTGRELMEVLKFPFCTGIVETFVLDALEGKISIVNKEKNRVKFYGKTSNFIVLSKNLGIKNLDSPVSYPDQVKIGKEIGKIVRKYAN